ncbi:hydrolase [Marinobacter salinus]|uniref:Hydrolase n=1 Tax=Marinobacter salinus TaxID=1874317 RepID=A0A1D9GIL7_9GAMM|nr:dienelactone hydrolase family protein [Marinobacter salinus]AOY87449.1 hydrolase [Marinobacter salinus]
MSGSDRNSAEFNVQVSAGDAELEGDLVIPEGARGIVVFAHGSGSSRFSPRNQLVASFLNEGGLATLLFDLLTPKEHEIDIRTREFRFDIDLLSRRLVSTVDWLGEQPNTEAMSIGLFGASTGAAAALIAAAERPGSVAAVVSRGGRPDLAAKALPSVKAPTLLIVGGLDQVVIQMNRDASRQMQTEPSLEIVPGATHLFEEPGKLEEVCALTRDWFLKFLT